MLYLLSKLLPLAVLPLGVALLLLLAAWLGRRRWPLPAALSVLTLFSTGWMAQLLWRSVEAPWQRRSVESAPHAAAIVVLSGGRHAAPGGDRISEWHDPDRFLSGVALFKAGRAPRLCSLEVKARFSQVYPQKGRNTSRRLPPWECLQRVMASTPPVVNTAEARAVAALLRRDERRVLLVTSAFHMRRAQRLFEREGLKVLPFPVDFKARGHWAGPIWGDPMMWVPTARHLDDSSRALREWIGRLVYRSW